MKSFTEHPDELLPWSLIQTVFLDMDGTLLDLHFDNHFWLDVVPRRYAETRGISFEESRDQHLMPRYNALSGRLEWYCVDYWTCELGLDIAALKEEFAHLIAVHPHVTDFLDSLRREGKRVVLLTNAHHKSLSLKMRETGLGRYFDVIISAHDLGLPKENSAFWDRLQETEPHDPEHTLLIDDNLAVLTAADQAGIGHLLAIRQPDSRLPPRQTHPYNAIHSFSEIIPACRRFADDGFEV